MPQPLGEKLLVIEASELVKKFFVSPLSLAFFLAFSIHPGAFLIVVVKPFQALGVGFTKTCK